MAKGVEVKALLPPAALVALPVAATAQHVCKKLAKESKNQVSESSVEVFSQSESSMRPRCCRDVFHLT